MRITKSRRRRGTKLDLLVVGGAEPTFQEENKDLGQGRDGEWTDRHAVGAVLVTAFQEQVS